MFQLEIGRGCWGLCIAYSIGGGEMGWRSATKPRVLFSKGSSTTYAALNISYIHPVHSACVKTESWYVSRLLLDPDTRASKKV